MLKKKIYIYIISPPHTHWKQNLSLKLIASVKEVNKAEGCCEEMSQRHGCEVNVKEEENWQKGILPHFPWGSSSLTGRQEPQRTTLWLSPAFWGCRGTWQPRDNVTDLLWPLLCDLWERSSLSLLHWIPGLSAQAPTRMPGYARCGGCIYQADLHTWMEMDWESSGSLWVHQAENI